jgi:NAD(P)-dependent dehydrogenase (short-subunit alcohol dehydrogenase family)
MDLHGRSRWSPVGDYVGHAISLALAEAGADLVVNYNTSAEAAEATVAEIAALGRQALAFKADVASGEQVEAMVDAAIARFGRLDVLVNSASVWRRTTWEELTEEIWDQKMGVDLKGAFMCAKAAAPNLAAHGDGAIVNIVDLSALKPFPNNMALGCQAGLLNLTYSLAMELGLRYANAVAPGPVLPPPGYSEKEQAAVARRTLLKRWGSAEDVAGASFLVRAEYITGVVLVDGRAPRLAFVISGIGLGGSQRISMSSRPPNACAGRRSTPCLRRRPPSCPPSSH